MSSPATAGLRDFFRKVWGDNEGCVRISIREVGTDQFKTFMPRWPEKEEAIYRLILKWSAVKTAEVYFSPALYSKPSGKVENVLGSQVAWAEFDGNYPVEWPEDVAPLPSIEVQSSTPKNRHVYWILDEFKSAKEIQNLNRSLTYALGSDVSGWDAGQLLRPPGSVHRKNKPVSVKLVADREEISAYSDSDFSHLPEPAEVIQGKIDLDNLPDIDKVKTLATWDADLVDLFNTSGNDAQKQGWDRSGGLARIAYKGCELGWEDEWIMSALLDADDRWGKYKARKTRTKILEELINRARAKIGYNTDTEKMLLTKLMDGKVVDLDEDLPDFMTVGQINAIPGRDDWTTEGLLTHSGIGLVTGRPGTGKTQFILQWAADLACGRPSLVDTFKLPGTPKKVLFLSMEMTQYQLQHFTTPLAEIYDDKALDENLVVWGRGEPIYFTEEEGQRLVDSFLDDHKPDVVFVDSLSQAATDISSDDEMKKLFGFLKTLRRYHKFALVFVHHHRKKANDAQSRKQANSQSDIYGSYQIAASVDFALDIEDRGKDDGQLDMHLLKARFRAPGDPIELIRDDKLHFSLNELDGLVSQKLDDPAKNGEHSGPTLGI